MSSNINDYESWKYVTIDDTLNHLGFTKVQQANLTEETRARYLNWTKEANNKVEAELFPYSDVIPLTAGNKEMTFAKSAALNWVVYKKRDFEGSLNARAAKDDFDRDIESVKKLLAKTPTQRMYPVEIAQTDSLQDVLIPYSQTFGIPEDVLF